MCSTRVPEKLQLPLKNYLQMTRVLGGSDQSSTNFSGCPYRNRRLELCKDACYYFFGVSLASDPEDMNSPSRVARKPCLPRWDYPWRTFVPFVSFATRSISQNTWKIFGPSNVFLLVVASLGMDQEACISLRFVARMLAIFFMNWFRYFKISRSSERILWNHEILCYATTQGWIYCQRKNILHHCHKGIVSLIV